MATSKRIHAPSMVGAGFWSMLGRGPVTLVPFDYKDTIAKARPFIIICLCNERAIPQ